MTKNWGSVAGGSFLNAFFNIFDVFSEMFRVLIDPFSVTPVETVLNAPTSTERAAAVTTFLS